MAKAIHVTHGGLRRSIVIHTRMTINELLSLLHATFSIPNTHPEPITGLRYRGLSGTEDTVVPLDYVIRLAEQMPAEMDLVVSSSQRTSSRPTTTKILRPSSARPSSANSSIVYGNGVTAVKSTTNKNKHIKLSNGDDSPVRTKSRVDSLASTISSLDPVSRATLLSRLGLTSSPLNSARSNQEHVASKRRTRTPSLSEDDINGSRTTPHKRIRKSISNSSNLSNIMNTPFFYSEATKFNLPVHHVRRSSLQGRYRSPRYRSSWSNPVVNTATTSIPSITSTKAPPQLFRAGGGHGYVPPPVVPTPQLNGPFGASTRGHLRRTPSTTSTTSSSRGPVSSRGPTSSRGPPSLVHAPSIDPDSHNGTVLLRSYTELLEQLATAEEHMVVLAIYARHSKPCREISTVFDRMAASGHYPDLIFAEIDAEYLKNTALQVEAVPTFHFYMAEHILAQLVGPSVDELEKVIVSSEALVHAQLATTAARDHYDTDSDTNGPTIYDESDHETPSSHHQRSDSLASSVTPSELDEWGDLDSSEDDYHTYQQWKLHQLMKQRAKLASRVQKIQRIQENINEPDDEDDEKKYDSDRSRRDSIIDDTQIDENYFAPPQQTTPLITMDEAAVIEKLILRQDPRVDIAYQAVPELGKVIDAFMRLAQSVRSSPTNASTVTSNSIRSAPVSTRSTKIPSDVKDWYDTESKHDSSSTSQYHIRNRMLLNDILKQLYDDGEISRSHIVVLHNLAQQQDGTIHDILLQYQMDGDQVVLVRRLKDVAKSTDPNKINFNLGRDVEKNTPRDTHDVSTSTAPTSARNVGTSTHRHTGTTTKSNNRDQSTSTIPSTTATRGTSTIAPRQVNVTTSTRGRTVGTNTSPKKSGIPKVPDSPMDTTSLNKLRELRDHLTRLESFLKRDLITKDEALRLARWMRDGHPLIQAALMAYTFNHDEMDLLDSFLRILHHHETNAISQTHTRRFSSQPYDEAVDVDDDEKEDIWTSALSSVDLLLRFVKAVPMDITPTQREKLIQMVSTRDPVILAAFELYKENDNMNEFVDTLYRLIKPTTSSSIKKIPLHDEKKSSEQDLEEVKQELQIMAVLEKGKVFDAYQAAFLRELILARDDCIMAAFSLAKQDEQWDEMHDTLTRLITRRRPDLSLDTARTVSSTTTTPPNPSVFNINNYQKQFANVVETMTDNKILTHQQAIWLCKAFVGRHPLIQAALEVFSLDEDVDELQDSLRVIAIENVKSQTTSQTNGHENGVQQDQDEEEDKDDDDDEEDDDEEEDEEGDNEETGLTSSGVGNSYGALEDDKEDEEDSESSESEIKVDWGDQPYDEIA